MREKIKEYMSKPYTKGDYANGIVVVCALYAILGLVYVIWQKAGEWKSKKIRKNKISGVYCVEDEDEEA